MSVKDVSPQEGYAGKVQVRFTMDAATAKSARALDVDQLRAAVKKDMDLLAAHKIRTAKPK